MYEGKLLSQGYINRHKMMWSDIFKKGHFQVHPCY